MRIDLNNILFNINKKKYQDIFLFNLIIIHSSVAVFNNSFRDPSLCISFNISLPPTNFPDTYNYGNVGQLEYNLTYALKT